MEKQQVGGISPIKRQIARLNNRKLLILWLLIFTTCAVMQVFFWHFPQNIDTVLIAWVSCVITGFCVFGSEVSLTHPFSSILILVFCLETTGLPLILLLIQGDPVCGGLEVPIATYFHLLVCQLVIIICQRLNFALPLGKSIRSALTKKWLRPLGFFETHSVAEIVIVGLIGYAANLLFVIKTNDSSGAGSLDVGTVGQKFINGFFPFVYAPFLLLLPRVCQKTTIKARTLYLLVWIWFLLVLILGVARNGRGFIFSGFAIAILSAGMMMMAGELRLSFTKGAAFLLIGGMFFVTFAPDLALAMRIARESRGNITSVEMMQDTFVLLTSDRARMESLRYNMTKGEDATEAWYVKNPIFSRVVDTHYQDQALAIALRLNQEDSRTIRQAEVETVEATLPKPFIKFLGLGIDKEQVINHSMGDTMLNLGARQDETVIGSFNTGGFIGDGYAVYGWWYLLPFGLAVMFLFIFVDSLYDPFGRSLGSVDALYTNFALVGLINSYTITTYMVAESLGGFYVLLLRQPFQWLLLYGLSFYVARFLSRALGLSRSTAGS